MSNRLDPDQTRHFVGVDLDPNSLQSYQQRTLEDENVKGVMAFTSMHRGSQGSGHSSDVYFFKLFIDEISISHCV